MATEQESGFAGRVTYLIADPDTPVFHRLDTALT
jgi:hypothetical protein